MDYKQGDRVLYNRMKFGTVHSNQFNRHSVDVVFDREKSKIVAVGVDFLELVADKHHESVLSALINAPVAATGPDSADELVKLANELSAGAELEHNSFKLRTTMKSVSLRLRGIADELKEGK